MVTVEANDPPALHNHAFSNADRNQIHLMVPEGKEQDYVDAGWTGFASINEEGAEDIGKTFEYNDITYKVISPFGVEIVDYTGTATELTIPSMVKDQNDIEYTVTAISGSKNIHEQPFSQKGLTHVVIPNTVTRIGIGAFNKNNLTEVTLPNGLTKIEQWVFSGSDLKEVTIPASVESIGHQAFYGNQNLTKVTVERVPPTTVNPTAFESARYHLDNHIIKKELVVPIGTGTIQAYKDAGWAEEELGFEFITSGMTVIDGVRYAITTSSAGATVIDNISWVVWHLTMPETVKINGETYPVTAIADSAFRSTRLETITIPSGVKSIGSQAFYRMPNLYRVIMLGDNPPTLDTYAFEQPYRHTKIDLIVPEGKVQVYKNAGWIGFKSISSSLIGLLHNNKGFLWEVTSVSPNEVKLKAYIGLEGVSINGHVEIPSEIAYLAPPNSSNNMYSVTAIADTAFTGRYSNLWLPWEDPLTSVTIPDGVTKIEKGAFRNNQLTSVDIPDAVTRIEKDAFKNNQLTSIEIPDKVTFIGEGAFEGNDLANVTIPDGVTSIGPSAFRDNQLTSVEIPESVTHIRTHSFAGNQLTKVTISGNVTEIDALAFEDNPDLRPGYSGS